MAKSKEILFKLNFEGNGQKFLGQLGLSTDEFKKAIDQATASSNKFKNKISEFGKFAFGVNQLRDAFGEVQGMFKSLSDAYSTQIQAEQQLQTVMQQRMNATAADIQSIKDLCSAQQELGVIGDEIQLAGAKQLAMFVSERQSLEALIPAMNNLVAQQAGLNATSANAESVALALGKAMAGQETALRRMGIVMTAAQKETFKYASEGEKAAIIADLIRERTGDMNAALAQTSTGKMKQLENTLGDVAEKLGGMVQVALPFVTIAAQTTMAASGIGKLVMACGMMGKGFKSMALSIGSGVTALAKWTWGAGLGVKATTGLSAAARVASVSLSGLKIAIRGLLISTGVGAVIAGLTWAIEALMGSSEKAAKSVDAMAEMTESASKAGARAKAEIEVQAAKLKALIDAHKDTAAAVNELNASYGSVFGTFNTAAEWYDVLISKSKLYVDAKVAETNANRYIEKAADYDEQIRKQKKYIADLEKIGACKFTDPYGHVFTSPIYDKAIAKLERLQQNYQICTDNASAFGRRVALLNDQLKTPGAAPSTPEVAPTATPIKSTKDIADAAIPEPSDYDKFLQRQREGLKCLQDYDDELAYQKKLRQEADSLGVRIIDRRIAALEEERAAFAHINKEREQAAEEPANPLEGIQASIDDIDAIKALKAIDGREYSIKIKAIGIEGLTDKIREVDALLRSDGGDMTQQQRASLDDYRTALVDMRREAFDAMDSIQQGWGSLKGVDSAVASMTAALEGNGTAWEKVKATIDGALSIYNTISSVIAMVQGIMEIFGAGQQKEGAASEQTAEGQAIGAAVGTAAVAAQTAITVPLLEEMTTAYMKTAAAAYMAAHAFIPFAGFGIGTGFTTAAEGVVQGIGAMKFAKGGIAYGPTLGLVGEYPGAKNNPEIIAPLDKLRTLMEPSQTLSGDVEFKIRDRELYGILKSRQALLARS